MKAFLRGCTWNRELISVKVIQDADCTVLFTVPLLSSPTLEGLISYLKSMGKDDVPVVIQLKSDRPLPFSVKERGRDGVYRYRVRENIPAHDLVKEFKCLLGR